MSVENPAEMPRDVVFQGWVGFLDGVCWPSKRGMGTKAFDAFSKFCHYSITFGEGINIAQQKAAEGAADFERITGFKASEFRDFIARAEPYKEQ